MGAVAEGDVEFRRGGAVLEADRIDYRYQDDRLHARGRVQISRDGAIYGAIKKHRRYPESLFQATPMFESELRKAETRHAELLKEYNNGAPERNALDLRNPQRYMERTAELKASVARSESGARGDQEREEGDTEGDHYLLVGFHKRETSRGTDWPGRSSENLCRFPSPGSCGVFPSEIPLCFTIDQGLVSTFTERPSAVTR